MSSNRDLPFSEDPTVHETEGETRATTSPSEGVEEETAAPVLTVLAHPDPGRVGDSLVLRALAAGQEVLLSRLEPGFGSGMPERADRPSARPLGGRYLSRQPIRLRPTEDGGVVLDLSTTRTRLDVDGEPVDQQLVLDCRQIDAGLCLLLARKVALWLHRGVPKGKESSAPHFGMVGESVGMLRLRRDIQRLAGLDVPVLLRGETGTGKELVARALHEGGSRCHGPFVAVNMGVLNPSLAAAELFGAARGAYTGADHQKHGYFRDAHGGTLLLDEIAEAPPEVQVMLLRVLETREMQPVGSTRPIAVDVRVIAATDARLEQAMASGRFRAPLFHRLAGYALNLPPLRHRREDLGRLLYTFLDEELRRLDEPGLGEGNPEEPWPSAELVACLTRHAWPGNVRELRNVARRLAIGGRDVSPPELDELLLTAPEQAAPVLEPRARVLPSRQKASSSATQSAPKKRRMRRKMADISENELLRALRENRWQVKATAKALNVSRPNLYRLLEECPSTRTANELERGEIENAMAHHPGDLAAAALELEVSLQGLKRRMKALDLDETAVSKTSHSFECK